MFHRIQKGLQWLKNRQPLKTGSHFR
jgi:hypothetical protein